MSNNTEQKPAAPAPGFPVDLGIIPDVETYLNRFVAFMEPVYTLPIALWIIGTYCFPQFDAFPYLVITSATKRSGKTRLSELVGFTASNARAMTGLTGPTMFRLIDRERPTIIFDEAERNNSEGASLLREVINTGYRRGQVIPRTIGSNVVDFQTYSPKVFVLIGDVYDTLRDRSIVVEMQRATPKERFVYEPVKAEGAVLRDRIKTQCEQQTERITADFKEHDGLIFLTDRDEEIWTPLFILAGIFCPHRLDELSRSAVDISTMKTAKSRKFSGKDLKKVEERTADDEYARRLLRDLHHLIESNGKFISSIEAIEKLHAMPTGPWRKFRGTGLTPHHMAQILERFHVRPKAIRGAHTHARTPGQTKLYKGYSRENVAKAVETFLTGFEI